MHMYYEEVIYKKITLLSLELYYLCNGFFFSLCTVFYGFMGGTHLMPFLN